MILYSGKSVITCLFTHNCSSDLIKAFLKLSDTVVMKNIILLFVILISHSVLSQETTEIEGKMRLEYGKTLKNKIIQIDQYKQDSEDQINSEKHKTQIKKLKQVDLYNKNISQQKNSNLITPQIGNFICNPNNEQTECTTPDGYVYRLQKNVNQMQRGLQKSQNHSKGKIQPIKSSSVNQE